MMNDRFESLESGEVISVRHDIQVLSGHRTFRVGELNDAIEGHLKSAIANWSEENNGWFTPEGLDCEALRFGSQGWQKGRIRLCLEFCPDEPNLLALSASQTEIPTAVNPPIIQSVGHASPPLTPPSDPVMADVPYHDQVAQTTATTIPEFTPYPNLAEKVATAIPAAGIGMMGVVATATAVAIPDLQVPATSPTIPHLADTTLELEEHHSDPNSPHSGGLEEIAFDFDRTNNDQGRMTPNGMMELDLTDLELDFSEHDLLNFEANDMSAASAEFGEFQNIGQPENSGMLIDEVWNEMNQGNWPKIN
jgi:KGK domain